MPLPSNIIRVGKIGTISAPKHFLWFLDDLHAFGFQVVDDLIHFRFTVGVICQGESCKAISFGRSAHLLPVSRADKMCQNYAACLKECNVLLLALGWLPSQSFSIEFSRRFKIAYAQRDRDEDADFIISTPFMI